MEKYRLKQWYPNLHLAWNTTDNYEYDRKDNRMYNRTRWGTIAITAPYLHSDFWELIKEKRPLFVTKDGVEVADADSMNVDELKIKALLEGLEAQNIEEFMREAKVVDYRNYGKAYCSAVRSKIEEKKPIFVTEDGVNLFDLCQTVYLIHPKTFIKQKSDLGYFSTNDLDNNKLFYHESKADEYVWKNKRVFSYNDIEKFQSGGEGTWWNVEAIAKGRSKE